MLKKDSLLTGLDSTIERNSKFELIRFIGGNKMGIINIVYLYLYNVYINIVYLNIVKSEISNEYNK